MKINQQRGKVDKLGLVGRDYAKLYHGLQDESEKPHEVLLGMGLGPNGTMGLNKPIERFLLVQHPAWPVSIIAP